ncbi:MAG: hypothetical protein K2G20_00355, partial [Lachnospiraceae bacterium]|nr:hypothetical protein [Lachnospiraceae bacterium]
MDSVEIVEKKSAPFSFSAVFVRKEKRFAAKRYPQYEKAISTIFLAVLLSKNCGYCGKLHSEELFSDFYYISGSHSYQQITVNT